MKLFYLFSLSLAFRDLPRSERKPLREFKGIPVINDKNLLGEEKLSWPKKIVDQWQSKGYDITVDILFNLLCEIK